MSRIPVLENNLKGWFGEFFVKQALSDVPLKKPTYTKIIEGYNGPQEIDTLCCGYPDYEIENTHFFIEVKTGRYSRLEKNQNDIFSTLLSEGNRIFLIRPIINIEMLKVEVDNFKCSEIVLNNGGFGYNEMEFKEIRKIIG